MSHEIRWLKPERVLYVDFFGHQTAESIRACLDDQAAAMDTVSRPVIVLINWQRVTGTDRNALLSQKGHRAYSHPMAARGVVVGFNPQEAFENEVTAVNTRHQKHTQYFRTMEEAMHHLEPMLAD